MSVEVFIRNGNVIRRRISAPSEQPPPLSEEQKPLKLLKKKNPEAVLVHIREKLASFRQCPNAQMAVNCRPGRSRN